MSPHDLSSPEKIAQFLKEKGFSSASTGGGFSAWFQEHIGRDGKPWQVTVSDSLTDTALLQPGRPVVISLYGGEQGLPLTSDELSSPDELPVAIKSLHDKGVAEFGLCSAEKPGKSRSPRRAEPGF